MSKIESTTHINRSSVRKLKRSSLEENLLIFADKCARLEHELELARMGDVFLAGSMNECALLALPVAEWDVLTAMTFRRGRQLPEMANNAEEFRALAKRQIGANV